jgi:hypothetical protein
MHDDDELRRLSDAWRTIPEEAAFDVTPALRRRRRQHLTLALEIFACAVALASAYYVWSAGAGLVHRSAAVLLVAAAVIGSIAAVKTRASLSLWADWTPEGVLAFHLRECESALQSARYGLLACGMLIAFAAFVWLAAEFEWDVLPPDFPRFYATVVTVAVFMVGSWSIWRIRTKRHERARLLALLDEFRGP